ncbi:hypothetical protein ACFSC4_31375 [Deinococcus malanensis]|uniref:hypothetical protein n=1 Tax=Deinococcus malanensis TaxID=1706855 RepID=UPI00363BEC3C
MAKQDTVNDIKAANGAELNPDEYTQKELDTLLALAQDGDARRTEFDTQAASLKGSTRPSNTNTTTTEPKAPAGKVSVRVNDTIAAYGGEFTDPDNGQVIGKEAVSVPFTAFVREKLRSDELVEE